MNARNKNGMTCLHLAAADNHASICSVLLDNRIDFDAFDENHNNGMYSHNSDSLLIKCYKVCGHACYNPQSSK